jgi:hypothetical protein
MNKWSMRLLKTRKKAGLWMKVRGTVAILRSVSADLIGGMN